MSKLRLDKINFEDENNFVVNFDSDFLHDNSSREPEIEKLKDDSQIDDEILSEAQIKKQEIIQAANQESQNIIAEAKKEAEKIINDAKQKSLELEDNSKKEAQELLLNSKDELEKIKIQATKDGYEEGHKDGLEKVKEEMNEKLENFSKFCAENIEIKNKVLKSASRDILDIIINISKKILYKELDANTIDKIIKTVIAKFEDKENITIIVSEKYAKLLYEFQNNLSIDENEFNFENFKQYDNFNIVYNSKYSDDTIIIENLKERFDASIKSQLDNIIRDIYEQTKNGQIELEQYIDKNEAE